MCGIVGYVGKRKAAPLLLEGLERLEYRGYDSAGLAVRDGTGPVRIVKAAGRLRQLKEKTDDGNSLIGTIGIGHTRWATHGEPTEINAHPHTSLSVGQEGEADVVGVHNGIIENYQELRTKLLNNGYTFYSQTDTEVLIKLVDYYYKKYKVSPIDALSKTILRVRGTYALAVMFRDHPGVIYVARKDSPMIIGRGDGETYIASDVPAILNHTRQVYYIGNLEMAEIGEDSVTFYNLDGNVIEKELTEIHWDAESAERGGYEHFMMKEIHDQPQAILDTLNSYVTGNTIDLSSTGLTEEILREAGSLIIVACGSAWHVGMEAQYIIEDLTSLPVRVEVASEFRYRHMHFTKDTLVIVISQSGETADSLAALRMAKEAGCRTLAIVNVVGSSIAREADHVMYTYAGPEIAVATTKAYSAQLICMDLLALKLAEARGELAENPDESEKKLAYYLAELAKIPGAIKRILEDKERLQWFSAKYSNARDIFFVGRGIDYAIGLEGSLKMKEISYIHSESYAAGEMKHGTISLIEDGTLVIGILTQPQLYEKTVSNLLECKSRGAYLLGLTSYGNYDVEDNVDFTVYVPRIDPHFMGSLAVIPLQLLGYYVSVSRGLDVDKPRNLAKSVTVE